MMGNVWPEIGKETRTCRSTPRPGDGKVMGEIETMAGNPAVGARVSAHGLDMGLLTSELETGSMIRYTINTDH